MAGRSREEERQRLTAMIEEWNASRLDLFALSIPNEDLEFYGVMRFFYQDDGQKVSTKCVRVSSTATTRDVMAILIEKFRPDMRMLSARTNYALYEVHASGEERQLKESERPLFVQLNWGEDDREGRFLLRKELDKTHLASLNSANAGESTLASQDPTIDPNTGFKRKLSKREKKELKKKEKEQKSRKGKENDQGVAEKLYNELPESNFTRSISNPELVMRKRRELKLEKKLAEITDGGPDSGGTLKIYGNAVNPDVPYKTLLLSTTDNAAHVVRETLDKYGLSRENPDNYCLVQVMLPPDAPDFGKDLKERVLDDHECPLSILLQHPPSKGKIMFQLRPRSPSSINKQRNSQIIAMTEEMRPGAPGSRIHQAQLPFFIEINPDSKEMYNGRRFPIEMNSTEIGLERPMHPNTQHIQHCIIAHTPGLVTLTPMARDAVVLVNGSRINDTVPLRHGVVVQLGKSHLFRFLEGFQGDPRAQQAPPHQGAGFYPPPEKGRRPAEGVRAVPGRVGGPGTGSDGRSEDLETTFDVDGNIETVPNTALSDHRNSNISVGPPDLKSGPPGYEMDLLPVVLSYKDDAEDVLLSSVIMEVNGAAVHFKLAPIYSLYLMLRSHVTRLGHSDAGLAEVSRRVAPLTNKIARYVHQAITLSQGDAGSLAFWMANASELLHFMKHDVNIGGASSETAQISLAETVQLSFSLVVECMQAELAQTMPAFLSPNPIADDLDGSDASFSAGGGSFRGPPKMSYVLNVLSSAMTVLRRCRVNAALTIQLFSKLFHFINHWLFNRLVLEPRLGLCSREWGHRLKKRLSHVEIWAEKQGLELAAECHLAKINQAVYLLESPKTLNDVAHLSQSCDSLNSRQVQLICANYSPSPGEPPPRPEVVNQLIDNAAATIDQALRAEGREVRQDEPAELDLPFLLPSDGYSCEFIKGVPAGLMEFIDPFMQRGMCRANVNPNSRNVWTIYMTGQEDNHTYQNLKAASAAAAALGSSSASFSSDDRSSGKAGGGVTRTEPEVMFVSFSKVKNSLGLSIVAAKGEGQRDKCIYVKSVVPGGAASQDGRLQAGDQLIEVDGSSLINVSQEKAAEMMSKTGQVVTLKVGKQGAVYHGLAMLLNQNSPPDNKGGSAPVAAARPSTLHGSDPKLRSHNEDNRYDRTDTRPAAGPRGVGGSQIDMREAGFQQHPIGQQLEAKSTPALSGMRDPEAGPNPYHPPSMYGAGGPGVPQGYMDPHRTASTSQPDLNLHPSPSSSSSGARPDTGYVTSAKSMPNIDQAPGAGKSDDALSRPRSEEIERQKVLEWQRRNQIMADQDQARGRGMPPGPMVDQDPVRGGRGIPAGSATQRLFPQPPPRTADPRPDPHTSPYQGTTSMETVPMQQPSRPYNTGPDYGPARGGPSGEFGLPRGGLNGDFGPGRGGDYGPVRPASDYNPARNDFDSTRPSSMYGQQGASYGGPAAGDQGRVLYGDGRDDAMRYGGAQVPPERTPYVDQTRYDNKSARYEPDYAPGRFPNAAARPMDADFPPPPPPSQLAEYGRIAGGVNNNNSSSPPPPPMDRGRDMEYSSSLAQRAQPAFTQPTHAWPAGSANISAPPSSVQPKPPGGPVSQPQPSGPGPVKGKKPPPPPAKPKVIPPDPVARRVASAAAVGGWSSGKTEESDDHMKRRRLEELRRLESLGQRSADEEARLARLRVEVEFDMRAAQAMQYDPNDTTLVRDRVTIRQPVDANIDNRRNQIEQEPMYARVDRNWNPSKPIQSTSSSSLVQPQIPSYSSTGQQDVAPPLPSMPPPEDPDLAPMSRAMGSALKQPSDISTSMAPSASVPVTTKKSVTFNDSATMQYSINRSYGSTSSESSYPQSPDGAGLRGEPQQQGRPGYNYYQEGGYPREGEPGRQGEPERQGGPQYQGQYQPYQQQPPQPYKSAYQQRDYPQQQQQQQQQPQYSQQRDYPQQQQPQYNQQQYRQQPSQPYQQQGGAGYQPYPAGNQRYSDEYSGNYPPPPSYVLNNQ